MGLLHVIRQQPDKTTQKLIQLVSEGQETTTLELYGQDVNYDAIVEALFQADKVFSW